MEQNKTSRYFKYAIGEIILVVIGILIALQINNWNTARLQDIKTTNYLNTFSDELSSNISILDDAAELIKSQILITREILDDVNNNIDVVDNDYMNNTTKLSPLFLIDLKHTAFQDMVNSGVLEFVKDRELRNEIFEFSITENNYLDAYEDARATWDKSLLPYMMKHMNVTNLWETMAGVEMPKANFENNLDAFINNKEFSNLLAVRIRYYANMFYVANTEKENLKKLESNLKAYLNSNIK